MKSKVLPLLLFFVFSVLSFGQKKNQVTVRVTDSNQMPVKGAVILVDQQNTGKQTNPNGFVKIKVDPSAKVICILPINGRMAEQPYTGGSEVNFSIPFNFIPADKVNSVTDPNEQVNIGYGTVSKKGVVSPVTRVNMEKDRYVYKNIYEMLRGKPGVQVDGNNIRIQGGINSLQMSSEPLFVVDGVPVNTIDDILPESVKSIEILKGSSASIYGSRGANGVILITLKK
jgi:TonB-dependent SusC/RagA subfamily outer membrane receptor